MNKSQTQSVRHWSGICSVNVWRCTVAIITIILVCVALFKMGPSLNHHRSQSFRNKFPPSQAKAQGTSEENFREVLKNACEKSKSPIADYNGVRSFYSMLSATDDASCYSWLAFGGELLIEDTPSRFTGDPNNLDRAAVYCYSATVRKRQVCFNREYKLNSGPCLVYSFSDDLKNTFEKAMDLFSCEVHSFHEYLDDMYDFEYVRRTKYWHQHSLRIHSDDLPKTDEEYKLISKSYPERHPIKYSSIDPSKLLKRNPDRLFPKPILEYGAKPHGQTAQRVMNLAEIIESLDHSDREISYLANSDVANSLSLLRQVISAAPNYDIRQISVRFLMPEDESLSAAERSEAYQHIYEVFQGLICLGYKYVRLNPMVHLPGVFVKEVNATVQQGFDVNFIKDVSSI